LLGYAFLLLLACHPATIEDLDLVEARLLVTLANVTHVYSLWRQCQMVVMLNCGYPLPTLPMPIKYEEAVFVDMGAAMTFSFIP
jgi:hypothetical protein